MYRFSLISIFHNRWINNYSLNLYVQHFLDDSESCEDEDDTSEQSGDEETAVSWTLIKCVKKMLCRALTP